MLRSSSLVRVVTRSVVTVASRWTEPAVLSTAGGLSQQKSQSVRTFADFSMDQLKDLRSMSGAPIVDCKKALKDAKGDLQQAMDWLRKHGAAKASAKVSGREATEGLVAFKVDGDGLSASLVKVSSETDFAGRSAAFVHLVTHVASAALTSPTDGPLDGDTLKDLQFESKTVQTALDEAVVAIRENLGLTSAIKWTSTDGVLVGYVHGRVDGSMAGSAAALVELVGPGVDPTIIQDAGKKLAMHIVAAKPEYLDADSIPPEIVSKEREIIESQVG